MKRTLPRKSEFVNSRPNVFWRRHVNLLLLLFLPKMFIYHTSTGSVTSLAGLLLFLVSHLRHIATSIVHGTYHVPQQRFSTFNSAFRSTHIILTVNFQQLLLNLISLEWVFWKDMTSKIDDSMCLVQHTPRIPVSLYKQFQRSCKNKDFKTEVKAYT